MALLGRDTWVKGPFPGGVEVLLETFRGEESLGRPYRYTVGLISHDPLLDANDVLGKPLSVGIKLETGGQRFFHGIVSAFAKTGATKRYTHYQATLQPLLGVLENTLECRIFNTPSQTALDIVRSVLDDCHITDLDATALSDHTYLAREYCLQYRESSFNFVQRLLEEEGIYYFFTHSEDKHTLVLADAAAAHKTVPGYESVLYASKEEKLAEEHFWDLRVRRSMYPGRHTVLAGYQPTELRPKQLQLGRTTSEDLVTGYEFEHYDYPGGLFVPDEAEREAKLRTEGRAADNTVVEVEGNTMGLGVGDLVSLRPGFVGAVASVPFWNADDFAKQYLVVRASYSISIDQYETGNAAQADQPFRARYWLLDAKKPFRTPRLTRKPVMRGPQTAVVVGPDHEEIWTDEFGRVCVQFDWDRQGKHDELSSCWMRVSSGFAGGKWGEVHIPRIGHEVLVRFLDGDPDRPIIAGELYSADNLPPYPLPANKTQSGTKSRSSKKGTPENFNEIRFEDLKGKEELHTQAEKDMSTLVKDSQTLEVGHDRKISVGHDEKNHVNEERALTVGADDKVTVLGKHDKTVIESVSQTYHGHHKRTVHGDQKLVALKNKDEHVGLVHKLTTDQKFRLNQSATSMTFQSTNATVDSAGEIISFAGGATFSIDETGLITLDSPLGVTLTCGPSSLAITPAGVVLSAPSIAASAGAGATMGMGNTGVSMNGKKVIIEANGVCKIDGKKKIKLQESTAKKGRTTSANEPRGLVRSSAPQAQATYEAAIVDEVGKPLAGISLQLSAQGECRRCTTAADGKARADLPIGGATLRFADAEALLKMLEERWDQGADATWAETGEFDVVIEVCRSSRAWQSAVPIREGLCRRIVLHPPYFARLLSVGFAPVGDSNCTVTVGGRRHQVRSDHDGWVAFPLGDTCSETAEIAWKEDAQVVTRNVVLSCSKGDPQAMARARLHNLGYPTRGADLETGVMAFQIDHGLPATGLDPGGDVPQTVLKAIAEEWMRHHG